MVFILAFALQSYADCGGCEGLQLEVTLVGGKKIKGFYPHLSYEGISDFSDSTMTEFLKFGAYSTTLYGNIHHLKIPRDSTYSLHDTFLAYLTDEMVHFSREDIVQVRYLGGFPCEFGRIITNGLSRTELQLLKNTPNGVVFSGIETTSLIYLSYDPSIKSSQLGKLAEEYNKVGISAFNNSITRASRGSVESNYADYLKLLMRSRKKPKLDRIIILEFYGWC